MGSKVAACFLPLLLGALVVVSFTSGVDASVYEPLVYMAKSADGTTESCKGTGCCGNKADSFKWGMTTDCRTYAVCKNKTVGVTTCGAGLAYSIEASECVPYNSSPSICTQCNYSRGYPSDCACGWRTGYINYCNNCTGSSSRFVVCDSNAKTAMVKDCLNGQVFDVWTAGCKSPSLVYSSQTFYKACST